MATFPRYLTPPLLAKLRGLRLRPRHVVEGSVAGLHRSPWRGFSIEFAEHREYAPGDDLRHLDWKVLGRTDKYYLKQYEDETNLLCYCVLDTSASMAYQGPRSQVSKREYAQTLIAALAHTVLDQKDAVGLTTFDTRMRNTLRPSNSPAQWDPLLKLLEAPLGETKTNCGPVFHELAERFTKRGVVVIVSDGFDAVPNLSAGLKHLVYRKHDVAFLHLLDAAELEFPFQGATEFVGLEQFLDLRTDATALRRAYLEEFEQYQRALRTACRDLGVEYVLCRTDQAVEVTLATWLAARMARAN